MVDFRGSRFSWKKNRRVRGGRHRVIRLDAIVRVRKEADLLSILDTAFMKSSFTTVLVLTCLTLLCLPSQLRADKKKKAGERVEIASVSPDVMQNRLIPDPGWTLRDDEGREIQAMLLSAHGDMVKIQRLDNDQEFDV